MGCPYAHFHQGDSSSPGWWSCDRFVGCDEPDVASGLRPVEECCKLREDLLEELKRQNTAEREKEEEKERIELQKSRERERESRFNLKDSLYKQLEQAKTEEERSKIRKRLEEIHRAETEQLKARNERMKQIQKDSERHAREARKHMMKAKIYGIYDKRWTIVFTLLILLIAGFVGGTHFGLLRGKLTVRMEQTEPNIVAKNVKIMAQKRSGNYKTYSAKLTDSACTLRLPAGDYTLAVIYDDETYVIGNTHMSIFLGKGELSFNSDSLHGLLLRAVRLHLHDAQGNDIEPDELSITSSDGTEVQIFRSHNNDIWAVMANDVGSEEWQITADGYGTQTVSFDAEKHRVQEIEVSLQ